MIEAGAEKLDELAHHSFLAQHLGDGQHQIGGGRALLHLAVQLEADDLRDQHRDRLAQHRCLRLDAADAPAEHGEAVDHRRMAVGADEGVGVGDGAVAAFAQPYDLREVFQIDLMTDAGTGRHDAEIIERRLSPAQEDIAFLVAFEFDVNVLGKCLGIAEGIHHHRMIDDEVDGDQRVDLLRIGAARFHRIAHRRKVDHRRHTGEILHQHPRRPEGDLPIGTAVLQPLGDRLDVVDGDAAAVLPAQQVFEQDLEREGQPGNIAEASSRRRLQAVVIVLHVADAQRPARFQCVPAKHGSALRSSCLSTRPSRAASVNHTSRRLSTVSPRYGRPAPPRRRRQLRC